MTISSTALDGLKAAETNFSRAGAGVSDASLSSTPEDSVDLSQRAVSLLNARNNYQADLKLVRVSDEITQATLNILS